MPNTRPPQAARPPRSTALLHATALLRGTALLGVTGLLVAGCGSTDTTAVAPSGSPSAPPYGLATPSSDIASATSGTASAPSPSAGVASARATRSTAAGAADATIPGSAQGVFVPYRAGATAITYDPTIVPSGASATVTRASTGAGTTVRLTVTGMTPNRAYGAHLHSEPCGRTPEHAGPHYQNQPDPKAIASPPSVDPRYANPRNEVWLDFATDAKGSATVRASVAWPFDSVSPPRSLVVHAERTRTAAGKAGTAGPRAACLTLPL